MEQKLYFLTFGGPDKNYYEAVDRIASQAADMGVFTDIFTYTDQTLKDEEEFWPIHHEFIEANPKGFGYWLWKPYIIKKTLDKLNENDILLYCDCGCELNVNGKQMFSTFIERVNNKLIIGTDGGSSDYNFTKADVSKYFGITDINVLKQPHMQAGCLMMKKCTVITDLVNEYYEKCCIYPLLDNSESVEPNYPPFVEHRWDQSIFNMLVKKYDLINYDLDPTHWGNLIGSKDNYLKYAMDYPIWYCRNRTGKSFKDS